MPQALNYVTGWKFLHNRGGRIASEWGWQHWQVGKWEEVPESQVLICSGGFHMSPTIKEANTYIYGDILAIAEVDGKCSVDELSHNRKSCHQRMRLVRAWKVPKVDSRRMKFVLSRPAHQHPFWLDLLFPKYPSYEGR